MPCIGTFEPGIPTGLKDSLSLKIIDGERLRYLTNPAADVSSPTLTMTAQLVAGALSGAAWRQRLP